MKIIYTFLSTIIVIFLVVFVTQNWGKVDLYFWTYDFKFPMSFISLGFYVLGALSGTFVYGMLRKTFKPSNKENTID